MTNRIDKELVDRNIFKTRAKAKYALDNSLVYLNGKLVNKANTIVSNTDQIEIVGVPLLYVSKGGLKLEKAVNHFKIDLYNKIMIDIGSSTGGFTDFALQNGIKKVIAIDVGTNQLDEKLRKNPKVTLFENTDFRKMDFTLVSNVDIATIDVSFISLIKLIPKLSELVSLKELICLVKPQFEVGKEIADKYRGIINDKQEHIRVINNITKSFQKNNYYLKGLTYSPIKGGSGNIEYLIYLTKEKKDVIIDFKSIIDNAFNNLKEK